ncbi:TPA: hypothetical protein PVS88_000220 [Escherichia coli]|nr:hypothetical protein [Escherichia coli]HDK9922941.1 hypothetical protein [Escherichia coli]HDL0014727.1 hypothetical protein [Escherichia coli]HDL0019493.1 hypothetical protein [Escherichia coli]HDL0029203.1 hypothetical protein [Escherichia coli]
MCYNYPVHKMGGHKMFKRCITKCGSTPDIQAFINEDGKLVVERSGPFISKQFIITSPAEMAGEWIVSEPEELHIQLPYGPQGLIYNRYVQKEAG